MGVPSFFKWLSKRYPKTLQEACERQAGEPEPEQAAGASAAMSAPVPPPVGSNPLIDNLYLDMNGIIHPCCHPDEGGVLTEPEMLARIWVYIQRLVAIARPRKVLYLAIDGVAPRAKMNQQRARRFRAAQETQQKAEVYAKLKKEWLARGLKLPKHMAGPDVDPSTEFDRNVITPGTPFMAKVAASLHFHVEWALQYDPAWKHLTVLFSSAQVPGEGEHKIINWIRAQRVADPENYDPNTRHCLYGMDADLIMLGLATHERYFYIIRESLGDMATYNPAANVQCEICGERGHFLDKCTGEKWTRKPAAAPDAAASDSAATAAIKQLIPETKTSGQAFQFLNLPILREYLTRELRLPMDLMASLSFPWDFENVIDDFILLCMFVGNDFLPHLPSLDIKEGALEMLLKAYKEMLPTQLGGYLSTAGVINLPRLGLLLQVVGTKENDIFARRRNRAQFMARKDQDHKRKIMGIRNDNARREREQNKFGVTQYEADGTPRQAAAAPLVTNTSTNSMNALPSSKPFIHPSRADPSANTSSAPLISPANVAAPPSAPVTEVDKITAAKANLSAAALLRAKLLGNKSAAASATPSSAATAVPASQGDMDTSSIPPTSRQQSDPIPASTAALSAMSTSDPHEDDTAAKANARAAQLLGQTMLGKRKSKDDSAAPEGAAAAAAATASAAGGDSSMGEVAAPVPTPSSSNPAPVPPSQSPTLELPLKKSKSESESTASAIAPAPSASPSEFSSSSSSASPPAGGATLNPSSSFDPLETDQFGNLVRDMSFEDYFTNKWNAINQPADVVDGVQFGVDGWKQRYYKLKLHIDIDEATRDPNGVEGQKASRVFRSYIEGLCWVMRYYFHGPASWSWFFIDHYAPMAEDLAAFLLREGSMPPENQLFVKGMPFEPVGQLLAVLPAPSRHCVPKAAAVLMTDDPSSPLHSFYPRDFENDLNGKKFAHQAVALLPFIDEKLLLRELARVRPQFDAEETARNSLGCEYVYVHAASPAGQQIYKQLYEGSLGLRGDELANIRYLTPAALQATTAVPFDTVATKGLAGQLRAYVGASLPSHPSILRSIEPDAPRPIQRLDVISAQYDLPPYKPHVCHMLPNADPVVPQLDEADFRTLVEPRNFSQQPRRNNNQGPAHVVGGYPQQSIMRGLFPTPPVSYPGMHPQQFMPMPVNGAAGGGYYMQPPPPTHMPMFMGGMPLHPHQQMMGPGPAYPGYYPPMPGMAQGMPQGMPPMGGMAPQGMAPQTGYYPAPMQPMPGMMTQGPQGQQQSQQSYPSQQPYPSQQMLPSPYNPALQTFLQAPPPPGHAAGYIPPPLAQMVPGFPMPNGIQGQAPMDLTGAPKLPMPPPPPQA